MVGPTQSQAHLSKGIEIATLGKLKYFHYF